jgi:hypothetical protein
LLQPFILDIVPEWRVIKDIFMDAGAPEPVKSVTYVETFQTYAVVYNSGIF